MHSANLLQTYPVGSSQCREWRFVGGQCCHEDSQQHHAVHLQLQGHALDVPEVGKHTDAQLHQLRALANHATATALAC
eukprot:scaffold70473_cov21-Tisochrysis_lutea.AAC.1